MFLTSRINVVLPTVPPISKYKDSPCYDGLHIVFLFEYNICRLLSWAYIPMGLSLNISQGTNTTGLGACTHVTGNKLLQLPVLNFVYPIVDMCNSFFCDLFYSL
jgi:hypothetical protein